MPSIHPSTEQWLLDRQVELLILQVVPNTVFTFKTHQDNNCHRSYDFQLEMLLRCSSIVVCGQSRRDKRTEWSDRRLSFEVSQIKTHLLNSDLVPSFMQRLCQIVANPVTLLPRTAQGGRFYRPWTCVTNSSVLEIVSVLPLWHYYYYCNVL